MLKKTLKYLLISLLAFIFLFLLWNWDAAVYGFRQAKGQLTVIWNTKPVSEVLADKNFPDSLKKRIELINEIKKFAVDSLGLNPSDNYTTFYDQKGKPILWVMTACSPFELKVKKWSFPIVGEFSYKGHFQKAIADREIEELKQQGYDTNLNEVSAWSTLGYLKDPILSSMLTKKSDGRLAALIIHELTHGTLFVKNNLEFNENLADFVGDYGAIKFLEYKYGKNSAELEKYNFSKQYNAAFSKHIIHGTKKLDSLYRNFNKSLSTEEKNKQKYDLIKKIMLSSDTLLSNTFKKSLISKKKWAWTDNNLPNNAYFVGYLTYQSKQNQFEDEFRKLFRGNFRIYLAYLKQKYPTLGKQ